MASLLNHIPACRCVCVFFKNELKLAKNFRQGNLSPNILKKFKHYLCVTLFPQKKETWILIAWATLWIENLLTHSHTSITVRYGPYWSLWSHLVLFGPVWSRIVPYGPIWSLMVLYDPTGSHMVRFDPLWSCMVLSHIVPYGSLWSSMVLNGPAWSRTIPHGPVRSCMVSYSPLWFRTVMFGSV